MKGDYGELSLRLEASVSKSPRKDANDVKAQTFNDPRVQEGGEGDVFPSLGPMS